MLPRALISFSEGFETAVVDLNAVSLRTSFTEEGASGPQQC